MTLLSADEVQQLVYQVWGASFVLSLWVGVLIHRGHFCTMGAISDGVVMGDFTRARQWVLAIAVAALGFGLMAWQGWIDPTNTIYAGQQLSWLSLLLGGALFGSGMVKGVLGSTLDDLLAASDNNDAWLISCLS